MEIFKGLTLLDISNFQRQYEKAKAEGTAELVFFTALRLSVLINGQTKASGRLPDVKVVPLIIGDIDQSLKINDPLVVSLSAYMPKLINMLEHNPQRKFKK